MTEQSPRQPDHDSFREPPQDEFDVLRPDGIEAEAVPRRRVPLLAIVIGLIVVAVGTWYFVFERPRRAPQEQPAQAAAEPAPAEPRPTLGAEPEPIALPPLDQSDAVVRELVRQLSSHPTIAAWLATDGLIRNFTVVAANIADGVTPVRHLRALTPTGPMGVATRGGQLVIDATTYHRYDTVGAAASSIDPAGAARVYATLKPRIEEAWRDLGHPDTSVDSAVERAIVQLLSTPVATDPVRVAPGTKGIGYVFVDPRLEALTPPQKQLIRMGPDNQRAVQRALRAIAVALGIPETRLPAPAQTD